MLSISVYPAQSNIAEFDNALENMARGAFVPHLDAIGLGRVEIRRSRRPGGVRDPLDSRFRGNDGVESGNDGVESGNDGVENGNDGVESGNDGVKIGNDGVENGNDGGRGAGMTGVGERE